MEEIQNQKVLVQSSANVPPASASSHLPWIVSLILLIAALFFGYYAMQMQKKNNELSAALQTIKNRAEDQGKAKADTNSKNQGMFKVISPKGGDVLCLDHSNEISWNAPPDLQTVVVSLDTSVTFNRLGEFPAVQQTENGVGVGKTLWNMKNEAGFEVSEGDVYRISLSGTLNGQQIRTTSDQIFSVKKCQEQPVPEATNPQNIDAVCTKENSCKFRTPGSEFRCDADSNYSQAGSNLCTCGPDCNVIKATTPGSAE